MYSSWMENPFGHDGLVLKQFYLLHFIVCNWDVDLDACDTFGGWARRQGRGGTGLILSEIYFFDNNYNLIFLYSCTTFSLNIHQFPIPLRGWCYFHVRSIAETADVRYACTGPIQVNAVRSTTRTTNRRQRKRTAIAGFTVNAVNLTWRSRVLSSARILR